MTGSFFRKIFCKCEMLKERFLKLQEVENWYRALLLEWHLMQKWLQKGPLNRLSKRSMNRWFCWGVSRSVTHKHQRWIWFTLSYAMLKALLRLAAVRDTKQAGELRGDIVRFIASSSAPVYMMQNGSIYRPLKQTVTCLLRLYSSKHIAENS